jgi:Nitrile hydratase beta subunit
MNGIHDCGGMQCYGPVVYASSEPAFHAAWEARVAALTHATWYVKNAQLPTFRSDIEGLDPVDYLRMLGECAGGGARPRRKAGDQRRDRSLTG